MICPVLHCSLVFQDWNHVFFFSFDRLQSQILTMLRNAMSKVMRAQRTTTNSRSTALVETARDTCLTHWAFRGILGRNFFNKKHKHAVLLLNHSNYMTFSVLKCLILQNITHWYFLGIKRWILKYCCWYEYLSSLLSTHEMSTFWFTSKCSARATSRSSSIARKVTP